jgi:hypothetical protein
LADSLFIILPDYGVALHRKSAVGQRDQSDPAAGQFDDAVPPEDDAAQRVLVASGDHQQVARPPSPSEQLPLERERSGEVERGMQETMVQLVGPSP